MVIGLIGICIVLLFPAFSYALSRKVNWLTPILLCYGGGILLGNMLPELMPESILHPATEAAVVLSIPLLLFSSDIRQWVKRPGKLLTAFGLAVLATLIATIVAIFLFQEKIAQTALIGAMMAGVYSGGTPNLNAIGIALDAPSELFVWLNGLDILFSGIYLLLLFLGATLWLRKVGKLETETHDSSVSRYPVLWKRSAYTTIHVWYVLRVVLLSGGVVALSVGTGFLVLGKVDALWVILGISTGGILLSFLPSVRKLPFSFETGDYLMLVFAFSMGALAKFDELANVNIDLIGFCATLFSVMLILYILLTRLFRIPWGVTLIGSIAAVFGPPFIGPVATAYRLEKWIAPGIAIAVLGNAVGTYLGLLLFEVLQGGL